MRRIVTKLVVGMAITAIGVIAADSSAATWKFNAAKSKTTSANPIKSQTDVRETTPDGGVSVTRTGQFKDGAPNEGKYSYKYDGKNGKMLTQSFKGTDTDGKPVKGTSVFDRE
jgi:hypothetical protein